MKFEVKRLIQKNRFPFKIAFFFSSIILALLLFNGYIYSGQNGIAKERFEKITGKAIGTLSSGTYCIGEGGAKFNLSGGYNVVTQSCILNGDLVSGGYCLEVNGISDIEIDCRGSNGVCININSASRVRILNCKSSVSIYNSQEISLENNPNIVLSITSSSNNNILNSKIEWVGLSNSIENNFSLNDIVKVGLTESDKNSFTKNKFNDSQHQQYGESIELQSNSSDNKFSENEIIGSILIDSSYGNLFVNNSIESQSIYQTSRTVRFENYADNNTFIGNKINGEIDMSFSNRNLFIRNNIEITEQQDSDQYMEGGIYLIEGCAWNEFINNSVRGNEGFVLQQNSSNNLFLNNFLEIWGDSEFLNWGNGFDIHNSENNSFLYNTINSSSEGISLYNSHNSRIYKNSLLNSKSRGIWIKEGLNNIIEENYINNSEWGGTTLENCKNSSIRNNSISNSWISISIDNSSESSIYENTLFNNGLSGIGIAYSQNNLVFKNSVFNNDEGGLLILDGPRVFVENGVESVYEAEYPPSQNNSIFENKIFNNSGYGIWVFSWDNSNIARNHIFKNEIFENSFYGIYIQSTNASALESNFIYENNISNNTEGGIFIENCSNNSIFNNSIVKNRKGVSIYPDSDYNKIEKNFICRNHIYDIDLNSSLKFLNNVGEENTCDKVNLWNDLLSPGCKFSCPGGVNSLDPYFEISWIISKEENEERDQIVLGNESVDAFVCSIFCKHSEDKKNYSIYLEEYFPNSTIMVFGNMSSFEDEEETACKDSVPEEYNSSFWSKNALGLCTIYQRNFTIQKKFPLGDYEYKIWANKSSEKVTEIFGEFEVITPEEKLRRESEGNSKSDNKNGGSGGGGTTNNNGQKTKEDTKTPIKLDLASSMTPNTNTLEIENHLEFFVREGVQRKLRITRISNGRVYFQIEGTQIYFDLAAGEEKKIDLSSESKEELQIKLISSSENSATLTSQVIKPTTISPSTDHASKGEIPTDNKEKDEKSVADKNSKREIYFWTILSVLILLFIGVLSWIIYEMLALKKQK